MSLIEHVHLLLCVRAVIGIAQGDVSQGFLRAATFEIRMPLTVDGADMSRLGQSNFKILAG